AAERSQKHQQETAFSNREQSESENSIPTHIPHPVAKAHVLALQRTMPQAGCCEARGRLYGLDTRAAKLWLGLPVIRGCRLQGDRSEFCIAPYGAAQFAFTTSPRFRARRGALSLGE